jgi:hypothetical protein
MENDQQKPIFSPPASQAMFSAPAQGQPVMASDDDEGLALGEMIAVCMDYRWLIAAICLFSLLFGLGWVV